MKLFYFTCMIKLQALFLFTMTTVYAYTACKDITNGSSVLINIPDIHDEFQYNVIRMVLKNHYVYYLYINEFERGLSNLTSHSKLPFNRKMPIVLVLE